MIFRLIMQARARTGRFHALSIQVRDSRLFDHAWYTETYPDTRGLDPLLHYVMFGEDEGRSPNVLFDPIFYRKHAGLARSQPVLLHYANEGWKNGLHPHPLFDARYYIERYQITGVNPLLHFLEHGEAAGFDPHPLFQTDFYSARSGVSPNLAVRHYLHHLRNSPGPLFDPEWYGGSLLDYLTAGPENESSRSPHPLFSDAYYRRRYAASLGSARPLTHYAKTAGMLPLQPHLLFDPEYCSRHRPESAHTGYPLLTAYLACSGDWSPHPLFDPEFYRTQAGAIAEQPLVHYVRAGDRAGLWPNRLFDPQFYRSRQDVPWNQTALEHYLEHCFEGSADPHPSFSTVAYVSAYPDIAPGQSPLEHHLSTGSSLPDRVWPDGADATQIVEWQKRWDAAAVRGEDLLIGAVPADFDECSLRSLRQTLERDPMFGCVVPRLADESGGVYRLVGGGLLPSSELSHLPEHYIAPELAPACALFRAEVVRNAPRLTDTTATTLAGALHHILYLLRRRGYRCVVDNRVLVHGVAASHPPAVAADIHRLGINHPDNLRARQEWAAHPAHRHEELLAARRTLLLDGRGIPAGYNGTSEFVLGFLDGLHKSGQKWDTTLLVNPGVAEFHDLAERYPQLQITSALEGTFRVAVRLSQPWYLDTVAQVHRLALANVYMIFDTIAWDAIYPAPEGIGETWTATAEFSDGLLYDSEFTRQRFCTRFPGAAKLRNRVCRGSLDACEYATVPAEHGEYILIAGNEYDHKGVNSCVAELATAFPDASLRVSGRSEGSMSPDAMEQMYARASAVVFPSFYEGFGFPLVRGLSYGKTVYARRSALADELISRYTGPGQVVQYDSDADLVTAMREGREGQHGDAAEPWGWKQSAQTMLELIEELHTHDTQWLRREALFRQMARWRG